jgi:hypothetical protein
MPGPSRRRPSTTRGLRSPACSATPPARTSCRATLAASSARYRPSIASSPTCASTKSIATCARAQLTTDHSPNCSSAPARASPKRSPSHGPTSTSDHATVQIQRQRARHGDSTTQTKGKRAHTVLIRPRLTETLRTLRNTTHRANMGGGSNPLRRITGAPRSRGSPRSEAVRAGALEASPCRVRTA